MQGVNQVVSTNLSQKCESAVDRLKLALSPSSAGAQAQATVLGANSSVAVSMGDILSPRPGVSYTIPDLQLLGTLSATLAELQQMNVANVGGAAFLSPRDGSLLMNQDPKCLSNMDDNSPRSILGLSSALTPRLSSEESLFDGYGQEGPHVELARASPTKNIMDPAQYAKYVTQREKKLYKTEMCLLWIEKGFCEYGSQCKFAHSDEERRGLERHPKFKTKMCRHFVETGTCPFGRRCNFLHGSTKKASAPTLASSADTPTCMPSTYPHPHPHPQVHPQPPSVPAGNRLPIFQTLAQE